MAPNVEVHFWAANDINGSTILEITDEDDFFKGFRITPDLYGLGGWELTLARAWGFQLFDSGAVNPEVFVRFLIPAYSASTYYYGGSLNKRDLIVVDRDEIGAEQLTIGGPGPKQYLDRYRLEIDQLTGSGWLLDLENGVWTWGETAKAGGVLKRLYDEDQAHTNPAMPDLTIAFDQTDDSDSNPWTDDIATDGTFSLPIGNSYLQTIWDLEDLADLYTTVHLGTVGSPQYELNAFESFGDDNSGSSFGAGVGLLREGVNIANDSLSVQGVSLRKATHVIVQGRDGVWEKKVKPSYTPGDYVKWEIISYDRSSTPAVLEKAGLRWLRRQDNGDQELTVEILPGADPASGLYFPAPNDPIWLGNTISVDTTADGSVHSPLDYNNDPFLVTGLELALGPAGDDSTDDKAAKSWDIKVKLNHERGGNAGSPNQSSAATEKPPKPCTCTGGGGSCETAPYCSAPVEDAELSNSTDTPADWPGTDVTTGACWSGEHHMEMGGSGGESDTVAVTPGDIISGHIHLQEETGNNSWENVDNYAYTAWLRFEGPAVPPLDFAIVHNLYHNAGCIDVTHDGTGTVPAGYDEARIVFRYRLGGWRYQAWITSAATPPDDSEFCIDSSVPTDSPYCLPSDAIEHLVENHSHGQGVTEDEQTNETDGDLVLQPDGSGGVEWAELPLHAATHSDGGTDEVDVTDLAGYPGGSSQFLREDGTFATPPGSGFGATTLVRKSADETVTNSTALQDDNHLVFAMLAGETWEFELNLWFSADAARDIKIAFTHPAAATMYWNHGGFQTGADTGAGGTNTFTGSGTTSTLSTNGAGVRRFAKITGQIVNPTNNGNLQFQWAQNSATGDTVVYANSVLRGTKLA